MAVLSTACVVSVPASADQQGDALKQTGCSRAAGVIQDRLWQRDPLVQGCSKRWVSREACLPWPCRLCCTYTLVYRLWVRQRPLDEVHGSPKWRPCQVASVP